MENKEVSKLFENVFVGDEPSADNRIVKLAFTNGFELEPGNLLLHPNNETNNCLWCTSFFKDKKSLMLHAVSLHAEEMFRTQRNDRVSDADFKFYCNQIWQVNSEESTRKHTICSDCKIGVTRRKAHLRKHMYTYHYKVLLERLEEIQRGVGECDAMAVPTSVSSSFAHPGPPIVVSEHPSTSAEARTEGCAQTNSQNQSLDQVLYSEPTIMPEIPFLTTFTSEELDKYLPSSHVDTTFNLEDFQEF